MSCSPDYSQYIRIKRIQSVILDKNSNSGRNSGIYIPSHGIRFLPSNSLMRQHSHRIGRKFSHCKCILGKTGCIPPSIIDCGTYLAVGLQLIDGQTPDTLSFPCVIDGGQLM